MHETKTMSYMYDIHCKKLPFIASLINKQSRTDMQDVCQFPKEFI